MTELRPPLTSDDYGLWGLVVLNSIIFIGFAYSFFKPVNARDWRSLGAYSAFIVALFAEMYGFPLTIYLLSGWLGTRFPGVNLYGHDAGHLWWLLTGHHGNPHSGLMHLLSFVFIGAGFWLLSNSWHVLYHAQRRHALATTGPYRVIRHPQYVGFVAIMFGFLLQWPTLLTLVMFPVLVLMYVRLAITEERDSLAAFGQAWQDYANSTPRFIPGTARRDDRNAAHNHQESTMEEQATSLSRWRSPMGLFMLAAGALGIYYLLTEHLAHVTQAIPYLFLLACPLMHLFHGHGHHGHHGHHDQPGESPRAEDAQQRP